MVLEDKLAETAPKKPLALTLGAAAVTLAVIIGVLAGPSVATCFNSPEGMGVCLRGEMTSPGILPQPPAVAEAGAAAPATEQVAVAEPEVAVGEPALDVTPAPERTLSSTGSAAAFVAAATRPALQARRVQTEAINPSSSCSCGTSRTVAW